MRRIADGLTGTQRYEVRHRLASLCTHCSNPRQPGATRCLWCQARAREAYHRRKWQTIVRQVQGGGKGPVTP